MATQTTCLVHPILRWTAIVSAGILAASCSDNKKEDGEKPPIYTSETTIYMSDQKTALNISSVLFNGSPSLVVNPSVNSPRTFFILLQFDKEGYFLKNVGDFYGKETRIIRKNFTPSKTVGIDVIAGSNYDAAHPKGSSLNDLMKIEYPNPQGGGSLTMALNEYFASHSGLDWKFGLNAKTPPLKENEIKYRPADSTHPDAYLTGFGLTMKLTLEDGTILEVVPLPSGWIAGLVGQG